jgi:hypothetical protein
MTPEELRATANRMPQSLGIALYIKAGRIQQTGPGERMVRQNRHNLPRATGDPRIAAASKR